MSYARGQHDDLNSPNNFESIKSKQMEEFSFWSSFHSYFEI